MAGTITITRQSVPAMRGRLTEVTVAWTSNSSGDVSGTLPLRGLLAWKKSVPGVSSDQPTDLYDETLTDPDGTIDLLNLGTTDIGSNLSNVTPTLKEFLNAAGSPCYMPVNGDCTFVIANAGNAKSGQTKFYLMD